MMPAQTPLAGLPSVHGTPVHIGFPGVIGIEGVARPLYGDAVEVCDDELPVFWACGLTLQSAICTARMPFYVTHSPGCLPATDLLNRRLAII
jgi:uncharacterized protein YcsI (UPF0317 family)